MHDELDSMPDHLLSETFAVEVAETLRIERPMDGGIRAYSVRTTGAWREIHEGGYWPDDFISFATDANAVLPFFEKAEVFPVIMRPWKDLLKRGAEPVRVWEVELDSVRAMAATLPRALCIAMIRAKRDGKL